MNKILFTIGYSGFSDVNLFVAALQANKIDAVCDVRSIPKSSYFETYNDNTIKKILNINGISYLPFGKEFGARQDDEKFYTGGTDSYLDFEKYVKSDSFTNGFNRIERGIQQGNIPCLMCAEKEPIGCHRTIMISKIFSEAGYKVIHILPNNETKMQSDIERELLQKFGKLIDREQAKKDQFSLFEDTATISSAHSPTSRYENLADRERINEAYRKQNKEIGFRWKDFRR